MSPKGPAGNWQAERRRRRRWIVTGVVLTLLLVGGGIWIFRPGSPAAEQRCAGLDATSGADFVLFQASDGKQCVGWTIGRDYAFGSTDSAMAAMFSKITTENKRVADQGEVAGGKPYVRVGVLSPMLATPTSAMTAQTILHVLQGAYDAQMEANQPSAVSSLGDPTPLFQLVLANDGLDEGDYGSVIAHLGALRGGAHPLVAMTGMGISIPDTPKAATDLDQLGIPSIGAVLTSDDMVSPELFKVSPSNRQYAQALKAYLDREPSIKSGFLVYDRNPDNYVQSLRAAFTDTFGDEYDLVDRSAGFNGSLPPTRGTSDLFSQVVDDDVCSLRPNVIFYAGRDRDLQGLLDALSNRGHCEAKMPLIIATGTTGLAISTGGLDQAKIGVLDASAVDPAGWATGEPGTPANYAPFRLRFVGKGGDGLGFREKDLADGYAIMEHDAVIAGVWAARRDTNSKVGANGDGSGTVIPEMPTACDVRNNLFSIASHSIPGVSGKFHFDEQPLNGLWPINKPVPVIRIGAEVRDWPTLEPFMTARQTLNKTAKPVSSVSGSCSR
jgi:hypothetical protein